MPNSCKWKGSERSLKYAGWLHSNLYTISSTNRFFSSLPKSSPFSVIATTTCRSTTWRFRWNHHPNRFDQQLWVHFPKPLFGQKRIVILTMPFQLTILLEHVLCCSLAAHNIPPVINRIDTNPRLQILEIFHHTARDCVFMDSLPSPQAHNKEYENWVEIGKNREYVLMQRS